MNVRVCSMPACQTSAGCRCGENVITLPLRVDQPRVSDQQAILTVRIPVRTYRRLSDVADQWGLTPVQAAEALLVDAINKASGVKSS